MLILKKLSQIIRIILILKTNPKMTKIKYKADKKNQFINSVLIEIYKNGQKMSKSLLF